MTASVAERQSWRICRRTCSGASGMIRKRPIRLQQGAPDSGLLRILTRLATTSFFDCEQRNGERFVYSTQAGRVSLKEEAEGRFSDYRWCHRHPGACLNRLGVACQENALDSPWQQEPRSADPEQESQRAGWKIPGHHGFRSGAEGRWLFGGR